MSCDIRSWGPSTWNLLHCAAVTYPHKPTLKDREHMTQFLTSLPHVLPCKRCGQHFGRLLAQTAINATSPHLESSRDLFEWTVHAHNIVNERTHQQYVGPVEAYSRAMRPSTAHTLSLTDVKFVSAVVLALVIYLCLRCVRLRKFKSKMCFIQ